MIYNIQSLRALAAAIVLVMHFALILSPAGITPAELAFGESGVDLFFVISGFVMVRTMQRRPLTAHTFLANRIIRVAPLYWLLSLIVFGLGIAAPHLLGATRPDWIGLVKSLLFIPYRRHDGHAMPILFVGWTLNYEMFFYALIAFAIAASRGAVRQTVTITILALGSLVVTGLMIRLTNVPLSFYSSPIMLEFAFGMLLGLDPMRRSDLSRGGTIAMLGLGFAALLFLSSSWSSNLMRAALSGLPATVIVYAAVVAEERHGIVFGAPLVQEIGAASYALYLTHVFPLQAIGTVSQRLGSAVYAWALVPVAVAAAIVLAILVHRVIERPVTDQLHRRFAGRRQWTAKAGQTSTNV